MLQRLINYWFNLEFFQPCYPIKNMTEDDTNLNELQGRPLPWLQENNNPGKKFRFDVYIATQMTEKLMNLTLQKLNLDRQDDAIEKDSSKTCLCALQIQEGGRYVPKSFSICNFVWALGRLAKAKDFEVKLDRDHLNRIEHDMDQHLVLLDQPMSLEYLNDIITRICNDVELSPKWFDHTLLARKKTHYQKKDDTFDIKPFTELIASSYTSDMERIQNNPGSLVKQYAEALSHPATNRIEIDSNIEKMQEWLRADRFPMGKWPSQYSPNLMQQLAINLSISSQSNQDIFSVNGPPGTGKTTLLKEIIASNIVKRAKIMATYNSPDNAFTKCLFESPQNTSVEHYYQPDAELTAYGMLVASNNNAAVENISVELPKSIEADRTGYFSRVTEVTNLADTYFSDIATELIRKPAWGLISARLGNKKNIYDFQQQLWWTSENPKKPIRHTIQNYYPTKTAPDWQDARLKFQKAWQAVEQERKQIEHAQNLLSQVTLVAEKIEALRCELTTRQTSFKEQERIYQEQETILRNLKSDCEREQENCATLRGRLSWFQRMFPMLFKRHRVLQEWMKENQRLDEMIILCNHQRTALSEASDKLDDAQQDVTKKQNNLDNMVAHQNYLQGCLDLEKERFGDHYADDKFWDRISQNQDSQSACPWTYERYDQLREELFYRALMLQKAFFLNSRSAKQNLKYFLKNSLTGATRKAAYGDLLNTVFLLVPVLSTTFASVSTFLEDVQPGTLGILIVDESGQATPQSALGAIWRTRKTIVVGDPLQVEPIMNTPKEFCKRFAAEYQIPPDYKVPTLSVQMLADAQNSFGGKRDIDGRSSWLGCPLVIHRRCIDPMFGISNELAYNNRMFLQTTAPDPEKSEQFILKTSAWYHIPGAEKGDNDHTVQQQIKFAVSLMKKTVERRVEKQINVFPNVYLITPFRSVKASLHHSLDKMFRACCPKSEHGDIRKWLQEHCGTIHTFQGKEADEVLLILGCDEQQRFRAACWVGEKPNIMNVAVSRAKYRIGIIGDYDLWSTIPNVQIGCERLQRKDS